MIPSMHWDRVLIFTLDLVMWQSNYYTHFLSLLCAVYSYFDTAKMLLLRKLFVLPINLISPTFSCTFSMLHLINLKFSQLISRPTSTPLLPFNTHSLHLCALPYYFCFQLLIKSSCNIMHNSLTDVGRTDVISFCQGIHSFTMPSVFFSVVCKIFLLGWVFTIFKHANLSRIHYLNISKFYQSPRL